MSSQSDKINLDTVQPLSSVSLQLFISFDKFYSWLFFILEIILFVYKGYGVFYPTDTISLEIFLLFVQLIVNLFRLDQGKQIFFLKKKNYCISDQNIIIIKLGTIGNKTESSGPLLLFIFTSLINAVIYVFYLIL